MDNPISFGRGSWVDQTTLHPLALTAIIVLGGATLLLPRRLAALPLIVIGCTIAVAQRVVLFNLDFNMLRLMVVAGLLRVCIRRETSGVAFGSMDMVLCGWAGSRLLAAAMGGYEMIGTVGHLFEALGMYFFVRCVIRSWDDLRTATFAFCVLSVLVAVPFFIEMRTGRNPFAFLGGVPEITVIRNGRLRCQGPFAHPIIAGCFWASLLPLIGAHWWGSVRERIGAAMGIAASLFVIFACSSSTPLTGAAAAVVGALMFGLRRHMRFVRGGILLVLVLLHLSMNKGVWYLAAKMDFVGGSTGWHRYFLIDSAIKHFGDWWLIGTQNAGKWIDWAYLDVTNQYVLEAIHGGLAAVVLLIATLAIGFRNVGKAQAKTNDMSQRITAWALGTALFVHCINFLGVSYFGQITMVWYVLLAMVAPIVEFSARVPSVKKRRIVTSTENYSYGAPAVAVPAAIRVHRR